MIWEWAMNRLREPSTWRGIVWLLTALGVTLRPDVLEEIAAVGMAIAGLVGVLASDEPEPTSSVASAAEPADRDPPALDLHRADAAVDRMHVLPPHRRVGVRPPIERGLDDHFSGGWGDR